MLGHSLQSILLLLLSFSSLQLVYNFPKSGTITGHSSLSFPARNYFSEPITAFAFDLLMEEHNARMPYNNALECLDPSCSTV